MADSVERLGEHLRRANRASATVNDVLDCIPAINSFYCDSGLTLRDILATTNVSQAFRNAFERSDVYLLYCRGGLPNGVTRRQWVLLHLGVARRFRTAWLQSWDETQFPNVYRDRLSQCALSPEWRTTRVHRYNIRPGVTALAVYGGAKLGGKAGAAVGTYFAPGPGTVCGAVTGAVAGGAAGYFLADWIFDWQIGRSDEYRTFKARLAKIELGYAIDTFVASSDPVAACYDCNIGHHAIDTNYAAGNPVQFVEDRGGWIFDRQELTDKVSSSHDEIAVINFEANPQRSGALHPGQDHVTVVALTTETPVLDRLNPIVRHADSISAEIQAETLIRLADLSEDVSDTMSLDHIRNLTAISSYRTAYAMLCRKVYLLRTALPDDRVQCYELRQARDSLQSELERQANAVGYLAKDQINAFARILWSRTSQEGENKRLLHAELTRAAMGDKPVAFTPLLALALAIQARREQKPVRAPIPLCEEIMRDVILEQKLVTAQTLLRNKMTRDPIAISYACTDSRDIVDEGQLVAEDREGHLLDVRSCRRRLGPLGSRLIKHESGSVTLNFRLSDLNLNIHEEATLERLREITLIHSHRTVYAVLCRKMYLLDQRLLDNAMRREDVFLSKDILRQELVEQITSSRNLANAQIEAIIDCLPSHIKPIDKKELREKLTDELDRAARGDQAVQFTPLLALEQNLVEMRQGANHRD
jgi:hypothetical protein